MTFIFQTSKARCGRKTSGMGKRDTELGVSTTRRGAADDTAFHSNSDLCTVSGDVSRISYSDYPSSECSAMTIVQRDILTIDGLIGSLEGLLVTCFVVAIRAGAAGGNPKGSRMGNFDAVSTVCLGDHLPVRVGGSPHFRRADVTALCRVGGPGRRDNSAAYRCGVSWGWTFFRRRGRRGRPRRIIARIEQEDRKQRPGGP